MKRNMTSDELARDDRFVRMPIPYEFLMADEVTFESVQSLFNTFVQDEKVRTMVQKQMTDQGGGLPFFNRSVRPTDDEAPAFIRSSMHGIFMGEVQALEGAGRSCWDFTDDDALPWKFQLDMARQCWDETRHVEIYSALIDHVGGEIGQFPENVMLFEFACSDDAAERVVGVNRCLEGLALDVFDDTIKFGKRAGDECIWRTVDFVAADEVTHVRFGSVWAKELTENDPERRAKVVAFQRKVDKAFSFGGLRGAYDHRTNDVLFPLATQLRELAGFTTEEIDQVLGSGPQVTIDLAVVEQLAAAMLNAPPNDA
jgi:uncharacterized ferritin-like protein (DUF455 family)